jgi:hypothetical protein
MSCRIHAKFAILILMVCLNAFGQTLSSQSGRDSRYLSAGDFEQFVAYWTTEAGWRSEIQLRNNLTQDLTVLPLLQTSDGAEAALPAVTIKPAEVKLIDIGVSAPQLAGKYGSAVLRYRSVASRALYASVMCGPEARTHRCGLR